MLHDQILELAKLKTPQKTIATALNCGITTVRRVMKKAGIVGQSKGTRAYSINSHVFDVIDTPDKAYWLGFMLADGCIAKSAGTHRTVRVSLQVRDEGHLKLLANFLGYSGKFFDDLRDGHPRKVIVFNDVVLTKALVNHGWLNYKDGISFEIIDIVPDELYHHFIRGYFDGDGCISSQKRKHRRKRRWYANIVCKFQGALEKMAGRLGTVTTQVKPRKGVYDLRWSNRGNVTRFCEYIYQDNSVRLERKFTRWVEFKGQRPFIWNNIHDFSFNITTNELAVRTDRDEIASSFAAMIVGDGWKARQVNKASDWDACKVIDVNSYFKESDIVTGLAPGNQLVSSFQPMIYHVRQGAHSLSEISKYPKPVARAVKAFLVPGTKLSPARLIRELRYAGFTMASLLSVPVIMAAISKFNLSGKWFDPCAGWGNRLLAAQVLKLDYEATDPGISFPGLLKLKEFVGSSCKLHNLKWQDVIWPEADFVLTSPPFFDKEDYLDGVSYGKFDGWYQSFLKPLVLESKKHSKRVVLHTDNAMKEALEVDFTLSGVKLVNRSRHKAPAEWFIEVGSGN